MGCVDRCGVAGFVPCASLADAEGWEAGTGPTMIGRITDAGIEGIDDAEGAVEDGSSLVACGEVEVEGVDVGCASLAGSGDRSGPVEAVCCEATCSTLIVESDADPDTD